MDVIEAMETCTAMRYFKEDPVPKETLVRVTKAEDGGMGGVGIWAPATTGYTPDNEDDFMERYLAGELVQVNT